MSFIPNPSLVLQNSLSMIGALSCIEFLRELPAYLAGKDETTGRLLMIKLVIAVVVVTLIMMVLITYEASAHKPAAAAVPF